MELPCLSIPIFEFNGPLGPVDRPASAEGGRAGLRELGPHLLGFDPRELAKLNQRMDAALKGPGTGFDKAASLIDALAVGLAEELLGRQFATAAE